MLRTPDGILNALNVDAVTPTDRGVAIVNKLGNLLCWVEVEDTDLRSELSGEVSERVYQAQIGESVDPISWEKYGITCKGKATQTDRTTTPESKSKTTI
jgi:hypothetical protein